MCLLVQAGAGEAEGMFAGSGSGRPRDVARDEELGLRHLGPADVCKRPIRWEKSKIAPCRKSNECRMYPRSRHSGSVQHLEPIEDRGLLNKWSAHLGGPLCAKRRHSRMVRF
jgi:hypothetical protein